MLHSVRAHRARRRGGPRAVRGAASPPTPRQTVTTWCQMPVYRHGGGHQPSRLSWREAPIVPRSPWRTVVSASPLKDPWACRRSGAPARSLPPAARGGHRAPDAAEPVPRCWRWAMAWRRAAHMPVWWTASVHVIGIASHAGGRHRASPSWGPAWTASRSRASAAMPSLPELYDLPLGHVPRPPQVPTLLVPERQAYQRRPQG